MGAVDLFLGWLDRDLVVSEEGVAEGCNGEQVPRA